MSLDALLLRGLTRTERVKAGLLFTWFFVTVATLWLLKPVRVASLLVHLGAVETPYVRLAGVTTVALVVAFYSWAVNRLSRVGVVRWANLVFGGLLLAFWVALRFWGDWLGAQRPFVWAVYVLVEIYSVVLIGIFWTYTNDVVTADESNRIYGVVGVGGILGGAAGGAFVDAFTKTVGPVNLLVICAGLTALAAGLGSLTEALVKPPKRALAPRHEEEEGAQAALAGAREVRASRYLMLLVGIVVAYEFTATLTDFATSVVFERSFHDEIALTRMYGRLGWIVSATALVTQIVLVPLLLPRKRVALLVPPVVMLVGAVSVLALPVVAMTMFLASSDRGLNYSIQQSTKESLYVPLTDVQKYKSKAFIDMFVDRAAKALAAFALIAIIEAVGASVTVSLVVAIVSMVGWALAANRLGASWGLSSRAATSGRRDRRGRAAAWSLRAGPDMNVTQKLLSSHLASGRMIPGREIGIRIDQTLTQDATGTLVMLEIEAMGLDRVRTELSVQYVDHNLLEEDFKNADDHLFLESACRRYGVWYSRAGNGVSHPLHQERFGVPGKTLLGSDSHTPAAGSLGMLAIGAGGLEVALAMAGEPYFLPMPDVWGVRLTGSLPPWVSAKDVILEMLRRHGTDGGLGTVLEYYGPGVATLTAMDRHVIANMGAELGATTTVFPADDRVLAFLRSQGRTGDFVRLEADAGARYDRDEHVDLSALEPLIAMPQSPGNVVPVREVAGQEIYQAYVGSSANPGYRDFAIVAKIVEGKHVHPRVSLDVNPTSRQLLENLVRDGHVAALLHAGARLHQAGCNGCIGMGQAPATDRISLRTVPRNFPGRSGTREDKVCLVSPETAAASALRGVITDPRTLGVPYPEVSEPARPVLNTQMMAAPPPRSEARAVQVIKGPNITSIPPLRPPEEDHVLPVLLKVEDDVSTDDILPAGARVLPLRSNLAAISRFCFDRLDPGYAERAAGVREHAIVAGRNYGQGSSREHAALAPAYLGLRVVLALGFARIHAQNLANFGVVPLVLESSEDYERLRQGDELRVGGLRRALAARRAPVVTDASGRHVRVRCDLSARQMDAVLAGGLFNQMRSRAPAPPSFAKMGA